MWALVIHSSVFRFQYIVSVDVCIKLNETFRSSLALATFPVLSGHVWPVAPLPSNAGRAPFVIAPGRERQEEGRQDGQRHRGLSGLPVSSL